MYKHRFNTESQLKTDTKYLVKCPEWNETEMMVCYWNGYIFTYSDCNDEDTFDECVQEWCELDEDGEVVI